MGIDPKLIDQLLAGYKNPEDVAGENVPVENLLCRRSAQRVVRLIHLRHSATSRGLYRAVNRWPRPCRVLTIPPPVYWPISRVTCARLSPVTFPMYRFTRALPLRRRLQ
jgi:hypothetical protein